MNRTSLPTNEILVIDRQRQDLGDIDSLAHSLTRYGLIQPIVINHEKRLIAGGRRLAAAQHLGWTHIDVVYRETLSDDELYELELEENVRRKSETWQERCLSIATIHTHKKRRSAIEGSKWGQRETAECLGLDSHCSVNYALKIADRLKASKDDPMWACESMMDAWRLLLREEEDKINAELAQRQASAVFDTIEEDIETAKSFIEEVPEEAHEDIQALKQIPYLSLQPEQAKTLYVSNPQNDPAEFDSYYKSKIEWLRMKADTINLSNMIVNADCIDYMLTNDGCFDHIITDIPYGIDMDMLNQGNDGHAFKDIDTVEAEHTVEGNETLFTKFFPAAYAALKDDGFCITWCDIMQWQRMYDLATAAGFKVQRWPITWDKTHTCMNQSAQYNFTKSTEIAIVCRKGRATLAKTQARCIVSAGRDELCSALGHPFAKPRAIWEYLCSTVSIEGQLILEPFAGRGSGVISMLGMKRRVIGIELNQQHYHALLENVKTQHFLLLNPNLKFK